MTDFAFGPRQYATAHPNSPAWVYDAVCLDCRVDQEMVGSPWHRAQLEIERAFGLPMAEWDRPDHPLHYLHYRLMLQIVRETSPEFRVKDDRVLSLDRVWQLVSRHQPLLRRLLAA